MALLILLRHGESVWNFENRFTGGVDVPLTETGRSEARRAGQQHISIDSASSSLLQRAADTLDSVLSILGQENIHTHRTQVLNERHYGELQGMHKTETARVYGAEQVHIWRRSYAHGPPGGESLKDVAARVLPYFQDNVLPQLTSGKNVLIVAHEHPLRAIIRYLESLTNEQLLALELATAVPVVYELGAEARVVSKQVLGEQMPNGVESIKANSKTK